MGSSYMSDRGIARVPNVPMTNHTDPIGRLLRDLELRSRSRAGLRAIARLQDARCDLDAAETLGDLSRIVSRTAAGHGDIDLTNWLILLAPGDPDVGLVVLAGLGDVLGRISRMVLRSAPMATDVRSQAVAYAWESIVEAEQSPQSDLARFVSRRTWSRTWSTSRRERRSLQRFEYTGDSRQLDSRVSEPEETGSNLLDVWIADGILSESQAELIRKSRLDGWSLVDLAAEQGIKVSTLQQRRRRAEKEIRDATRHRSEGG